MLQFPDKYFVGIRPSGLAFATPEGTDSAAQKRKDTVRHWTEHPYYCDGKEPRFETMDNVPVSGFTLGDAVSRWSTSNKLFRITDPRGYDLEISTYNLAELISKTTIIKGVIQEELVWARNGSTNELVLGNDPRFLDKDTKFNPKPGETLKYEGSEYLYLGKKYFAYIGTEYVTNPDWSIWGQGALQSQYIAKTVSSYDDKPVHAYARVTYKGDIEVVLRRSPFPAKKCRKVSVDIAYTPGWNESTSDLKHVPWNSKINLTDSKAEAKKIAESITDPEAKFKELKGEL